MDSKNIFGTVVPASTVESMTHPQYFLASLPRGNARIHDACGWLLLGVLALGLAGVFAGFLANTKSDFFYPALVVHVDLSMLVWFLSAACLMLTLLRHGEGIPLVQPAAKYCFIATMVLMAVSVFLRAPAYMSNYIPVIHHPLFFLALGLLASGTILVVFEIAASLAQRMYRGTWEPVDTAGAVTCLLLVVSCLCFALSADTLPEALDGQIFYEYAFWGGGHMLQFVHVQLLLLAWLWLAQASGVRLQARPWILHGVYALGIIMAMSALALYFHYPVFTEEHRHGFTKLMWHGNGFAPLIAALLIMHAYFFRKGSRKGTYLVNKVAATALIVSFLLFFVGGVLGYFIEGSNLIIPAHYHGSIIGITIAFMGIGYLLLPVWGYADVSGWRLARIQPLLYGGGQLCWIAGMTILGAHGVARKTPGSAESVGALAAFLKHAGDGLSLLGGLLFVYIVLRAIKFRANHK